QRLLEEVAPGEDRGLLLRLEQAGTGPFVVRVVRVALPRNAVAVLQAVALLAQLLERAAEQLHGLLVVLPVQRLEGETVGRARLGDGVGRIGRGAQDEQRETQHRSFLRTPPPRPAAPSGCGRRSWHRRFRGSA